MDKVSSRYPIKQSTH